MDEGLDTLASRRFACVLRRPANSPRIRIQLDEARVDVCEQPLLAFASQCALAESLEHLFPFDVEQVASNPVALLISKLLSAQSQVSQRILGALGNLAILGAERVESLGGRETQL
jgi:hypothetical protein